MYRHRISEPVTVKLSGDPRKVTALINLLNRALGEHQLTDLCVEPYAHGRKDGLREQTAYLDIEPERSYDTKAEKPFEDKSGDLYVMQSRLQSDKFKVGISIHVAVRVQQVSRTFQEPFKRIHTVHCTQAKAREMWVHNQLRAQGAVDLGHEQFLLKDRHLDWLRSLPSE